MRACAAKVGGGGEAGQSLHGLCYGSRLPHLSQLLETRQAQKVGVAIGVGALSPNLNLARVLDSKLVPVARSQARWND